MTPIDKVYMLEMDTRLDLD